MLSEDNQDGMDTGSKSTDMIQPKWEKTRREQRKSEIAEYEWKTRLNLSDEVLKKNQLTVTVQLVSFHLLPLIFDGFW